MTVNKNQNATTISWLKGDGMASDIVLTTRVRLARNLVNIPFPPRARLDDLKKAHKLIDAAIDKHPYFISARQAQKFTRIMLDDLSDLDKHALVEQYIASPAFIGEKGPRSICFNKDKSVSFLINEEDHLRLQALSSGLELEKAWDMVNKLDDALEECLDFAYSEGLGYLSTCPTNLGTGLRASVMLHLPAVTMMNMLEKIAPKILQMGLAIRGIYGEGTEAHGHFYQISNQISLGPREEDIIEKMKGITLQIVEHETATREKIHKDMPDQIKDRIWRSFGILKNARMITSSEALELLSMVRAGVCLKVLPEIPFGALNEIFLLIRPAYLQKTLGKVLEPANRDAARAEVIRKKLNKF